MDQHDRGDAVAVEATFTDANGTATSPTTVTLRLRDPAGTLTDPVPTNPSVGRFVHTFTPGASGVWRWRFNGTGGVTQEVEGRFYVRERTVG